METGEGVDMSQSATVQDQVYRGVMKAIIVTISALIVVGLCGWLAYAIVTDVSPGECAAENIERLSNGEPREDCY